MRQLFSFFISSFFIFTVSSFSESKDKHVFLLIGQSNMCGRAKLKAGDDKVIKDCSLWNGKEWEDAKAPFNRYSTHKKGGSTQGMNPGPEFVRVYQKANPGVTVGIINWARGGSKIEQWTEKQNLYTSALSETKNALKGNARLIGILWHQGESNSKKADLYPKQLKELIERLRKDLKQPELPVVYGQIGQWQKSYKPFNDMIVNQPKLIPNTACISSEGLTNMDRYHFDHKSQLEMGRRYATEMLKLLKK